MSTLTPTNGTSPNGGVANGATANGALQKRPTRVAPARPFNKVTRSGSSTYNGSPSTGTAPWPIVMLRVDQIDASPYQPRIVFDPQELEELAQSVRAQGVQQPVLVRTVKVTPDTDGNKPGRKAPVRYELIAGERRLRACRMAERKTLPAIVRDDLSDAQAAELCLLENVQRSGLSAIEEARGYKRLMLDFRLKEERLARKVGKSVGVLREMMKLLLLPSGVQDFIVKRQLTPAHGHELLRLCGSPDVCQAVAAYAVLHNLPATALRRDVLPNARELEKRGHIVSLDHRTRFDRTLCRECPHKAHLTLNYNSYCLKPDEWKRKQLEAQMRQSDEASRVLEEARHQADEAHRAATLVAASQVNGEQSTATGETTEEGEANAVLPLLSDLPRGDYRDLRWGETPLTCSSACPCRGLARDGNGNGSGDEGEEDAHVAICLDPKRFQELVRTDRERKEEEKRQHFADLSDQAIARLSALWSEGQMQPALSLILLPFLDGRSVRRNYLDPNHWEAMWRALGEKLEVELPWDELFDDETQETDQLRILSRYGGETQKGCQGESQREAPGALRIVLLVAALLVTLETQEAARWGGETPLLSFILEPDAKAQMALEIDAGEESLVSPVQRWSDPDFMEDATDEEREDGFFDDFDAESADAMEADFPQLEPSTLETSNLEVPNLEASNHESVPLSEVTSVT